MRLALWRGMTPHPIGRSSQERGFTLLELLIVVGILGTLASLSALFLIQAKKSANEASAVATLQAINSGQSAFAVSCGRNNYATALAVLVDGNYVAPDANLSPKSGYYFAMLPGNGEAGPQGCSNAETRTSYYIAATPVSSTSGTRGFATNQNGVIWQDRSGVAPSEPFVSSALVSPLQSH